MILILFSSSQTLNIGNNMSVASMGFYCRGDFGSCLGECYQGSDRSGGPFGMEHEELAHLVGMDVASDSPMNVHTSNLPNGEGVPQNIRTWIDSAYPDCVPTEVV